MTPELFQAIESHDLGLVRELLARGANPNAACKVLLDPVWTPLKEAIDAVSEGGPIEAVQLLLEFGASVNGHGLPGERTPLLVAVGSQLYDVVKLLLEHHADCTLRDDMGDFPLFTSVDGSDLIMAKLLLGHCGDAAMNAWGGPGATTSLGWAAKMLNLPMIDLLLDAGADPNAEDGDHLKAWQKLPPRESADSHIWDMAAERLARPQ